MNKRGIDDQRAFWRFFILHLSLPAERRRLLGQGVARSAVPEDRVQPLVRML